MNAESEVSSGGDEALRAVLERADAQWKLLRTSNPEYFAQLEDANPMLARRADLLNLMNAAPKDNDAVFMYLFANYSMRLEIAAITGREFL